MTEIKKRILSSIGILLLIIISSYNNTFLGLVSIFVFFQLFYEFLNIYKKIINKNKVHLYFVLFFTLLYLLACLILIWSIIVGNLSSEKIYLYIIIAKLKNCLSFLYHQFLSKFQDQVYRLYTDYFEYFFY